MDKIRPFGADFRVHQEFKRPAVVIEAGREIVPCAGKREIVPITLAPFKDSGRPAFIASTIKSKGAFIATASALSEEDSQRLNALMTRTMEGLLDTGTIRDSATIFRSSEHRPDVHVITSGDTFKNTSLRLYCHIGEYEDFPVLYQDARVTRRGAVKIERILAADGKYIIPSTWRT